MAKRTTKLLQYRSDKQSHKYSQGIGYHIPTGMTQDEWAKLRAKWEKKLQDSGFPEIEQFSHDSSGRFSPFFTKTVHSNSRSGSAATEASQYRGDVAEYYRRVGIFRHHADLWALFGKGKHGVKRYWTIWHILRMLADGAIYRSIAAFFGTKKCPPSLRARKSYFFAYHHIERPSNKRAINKVMAQWFKENPEWLD